MIEVYIYSLILISFTIPFGYFFNKNTVITIYSLSKDTLYGIIFLSFGSLLLNFFFPINIYIASIILIVSFVIILFNKKKFFNFLFLKFILIKGLLITILILESNVYRPDAGLYHLPYVGILNSEKILLGISNIHFRYGHTSIIQYFSALSNNFIFRDNGIIFVQAILASSIIINFANQLFEYNKKKKYNFHFFYLFFVFIYIAYKINRYSEYGNDATAHLILFFLVSEILIFKDKFTHSHLGNQFVLALFIISNKLTLIFALFLPLVNFQKIKVLELILNKRFIFVFLFFWLWILKNFLVTGCALYPVKSTCFSKVIWTDLEEINRVSIASEAWAKGWPNRNLDNNISQKEFNNDFNWLDAWSKVHLKYIIKIQLPYVIFLILIIIILRLKSKKSLNYSLDLKNIYLLAIILMGLIFWFIKAPMYRYGYSYIVIFISFLFSFYMVKLNIFKKFQNFFFTTVLLFSLSVLILKNIHRITVTNNEYYNYPWPKFYSMQSDNLVAKYKKKQIGHKTILNPIDGYCMYVKGICSHYETKKNLRVKKYYNYDIFYYNTE
jgi:hypothetical protein